jgi:hypothetical protein
MRIRLPKIIQIHADPDPQHCLNVQQFKTKKDSDTHRLIPKSIKNEYRKFSRMVILTFGNLIYLIFSTFLRLLFYLCDSSLEVLSCKEDISVILFAIAQKSPPQDTRSRIEPGSNLAAGRRYSHLSTPHFTNMRTKYLITIPGTTLHQKLYYGQGGEEVSLEKITNLKHVKLKGHRKVKGTVSEKVDTLLLVNV